MASLPKQLGFPMCTVRETPRLPEHCIQYAYVISWEETFGKSKVVDKDSPVDMKWIYEKALERAERYGISGVTYQLTMGVVKNIIPAIASTNALISAACVNEAIKIATGCNFSLDNYMLYMGQSGINSHTFNYERSKDCIVCSKTILEVQSSRDHTLKTFLGDLIDKLRLSNPSIDSIATGKTLYISGPPQLEQAHRFKKDLSFRELASQGFISGTNKEEFMIIDGAVPSTLTVRIVYDEDMQIN